MSTPANASSPVADLFGEDEIISGTTQEILASLGRYGIQNLAYAGDHGSNPGYIFRGEIAYPCPLQCGIEHAWRSNKETSNTISGTELKDKEKGLLEQFLIGDGPLLARLVDRQAGTKSWDDVWWWLSLMQHYKRNTRLIDFSRDIRMALYFAVEQHEAHFKNKNECLDPVIYCFPCRDLKHPHDKRSNKCPILPMPEAAGVDMNLAIGCMIDLKSMERHKLSWVSKNGSPILWTRNQGQTWGWDRPHDQNPRIDVQKGMFVYAYDYPDISAPLKKTDAASWLVQNLRRSATNTPNDPFLLKELATALLPKRIHIHHEHVSALKKHLRDSFQLSAASVYLDHTKV
ncbi:MAG: FRG domain-containing protein [Opitutales bacterium]